MSDEHFFHLIEVRYGDLDPQGHVNNARYLTFMEQARSIYIRQVGLWNGKSFLDIGIILAHTEIDFLSPILYGQTVKVTAQVTRLGNKSFTMEHRLEAADDGTPFAKGLAVLVAYDYYRQKAIPIPPEWRHTIENFEGLSLSKE